MRTRLNKSAKCATRILTKSSASNQITDDEKLTIATLNLLYSSIAINDGNYTFTNLVKLLAQNVTSFTKSTYELEHSDTNKY
jgi:hypothetical protein